MRFISHSSFLWVKIIYQQYSINLELPVDNYVEKSVHSVHGHVINKF